ncbi:hypothetical protein ACFZAC_14745 [Pseudomonas fluorescens]|uniref:hypothetical protein n=1 Tax=Pseudomonas fluorescens TaxID=294 RepID=UPI003748148A
MTDPPVTVSGLYLRNEAFASIGKLRAHRRLAGLAWPVDAENRFSLNRMKILKKNLPSQKLSTTLARLDRQNMFEEIR